MLEFDRYIKDAYLDLNDPNYQFVGDALEAKRHGNISELFRHEGFEVEDDTDPNSDVCRTLILPVDGKYIVVKLSFVGPFAAVFAPGVPQTAIEKARKLIQENGLQVLDQEQLQQPCEIDLTDIDARPMIYNALFSTDDMPI
ncbi:hypothetical protein ACFSE1_18050 [Rhizobium helianthi]|uniref:Uncharacterized protein n=1 Tax=Rhizobium helianthi TaxID=1132695 RepID=A0ABW4M7E7_9HYPH